MSRFAIFALILVTILMLSAPVMAARGEPQFTDQLISTTADVSAENLDTAFIGSAIYVVYVYSSVDSDISLSLDLPVGSGSVNLADLNNIDATSGYKYKVTTAWPLNTVPNYTLEDVGSGQVDIVFVGGN